MIICGHAHLGEDKDETVARAQFIRSTMARYKIDRSVVFPLNERDPGVSFSNGNNSITLTVSKDPYHFIGFARLDPKDPFCMSELSRAINELRLRGIKLHPNSQEFKVSDQRVLDIIKEAELLDVPVIFHTDAVIAQDFEEMMSEVSVLAPRAKIIMGHSGMSLGIDEAKALAKKYSRNISLEISICSRETVKEIVRSVSATQIIFGTDTPYGNSRVIVSVLDLLNNDSSLNTQDRTRILGGNVAKLVARDSYWSRQRIMESSKLVDQQEVGVAGMLDSNSPVEELVGSAHDLTCSSCETMAFPVDFSGGFILENVAYLYCRIGEASMALVADGWNSKLYIFCPALRFPEVLSGKGYLSEFVEDMNGNFVVDGPLDCPHVSLGQKHDVSLLKSLPWNFKLKPMLYTHQL
jgi:predicted TIM-barrel fold metal-dependent hydrolase